MKRAGLTNPELLHAIASLGHTDTFVIADAGLPLPQGVRVIDLSIDFGFPTFEDVAKRVLPEVIAEKVILAKETPEQLIGFISIQMTEAEVVLVPHEELKHQLVSAKFIIRTGSTTPFSNAIVTSGVPF